MTIPASDQIDARKLGRPSTDRYRDLIGTLITVDQDLADGMHPLKASILALKAVHQFIGSDPPLRRAGISVALRRLLADLDDVGMGAHPPMLFDGGFNSRKSGRKKNQTFNFLRACIVKAVDGLIVTKVGKRNIDSAKLIETMLSQRGVRLKGKAISAETILQWREQMNDTGPKDTDEFFKMIQADEAKLDGTPETAKRKAEVLVEVVARWNSN